MNRKTVAAIGVAMTVGILSLGAVSASAAASCCDGSKCADRQAVEQFVRESAAATAALKAKELELRGLYGSDGIDNNKVTQVEGEIRALKEKIKPIAERYRITSCCLG